MLLSAMSSNAVNVNNQAEFAITDNTETEPGVALLTQAGSEAALSTQTESDLDRKKTTKRTTKRTKRTTKHTTKRTTKRRTKHKATNHTTKNKPKRTHKRDYKKENEKSLLKRLRAIQAKKTRDEVKERLNNKRKSTQLRGNPH